jgi:hypothetical protein
MAGFSLFAQSSTAIASAWRIRPAAGDNQDTGVVDDAKRAAAVMEAYRLEQKVLGLEPGEAGVVLNEQSA